MIEINGKVYPMWSQFVEKKAKYVGGVLTDYGDGMDRRIFKDELPARTIIKDILLRKNGNDSAMFEIIGKDFTCGFDVQYGGLAGRQFEDDGSLEFSGYGGHTFSIKAVKSPTPKAEV